MSKTYNGGYKRHSGGTTSHAVSVLDIQASKYWQLQCCITSSPVKSSNYFALCRVRLRLRT